jgi:DNA-directed RNA polymerase subunit RPC12/RpoP
MESLNRTCDYFCADCSSGFSGIPTIAESGAFLCPECARLRLAKEQIVYVYSDPVTETSRQEQP